MGPAQQHGCLSVLQEELQQKVSALAWEDAQGAGIMKINI